MLETHVRIILMKQRKEYIETKAAAILKKLVIMLKIYSISFHKTS